MNYEVRSCIFASFFSLFLFVPAQVFAADVVINEFASDTAGTIVDPDWVEIYNTTSSSIDLSAYRLEDLNATNTKTLSGTIDPASFATIDWSNKLNKSGDVIRLIKVSDGSVIDSVGFGDQGSDVGAPSGGQSAGRSTDGGTTWIIFSVPTKRASNNSSQAAPTATSTPQPSPTNAPTPTKAPTPTRTPTATATSKPSQSSSSSQSTATQIPSAVNTKKSSTNETSGDILSASESPQINLMLNESTEESQANPSTEVVVAGTKDNNVFRIVLIGLGTLMFIFGIILLWKKYLQEKAASEST